MGNRIVIPAEAGIQSENSELGSPGVPEDDKRERLVFVYNLTIIPKYKIN